MKHVQKKAEAAALLEESKKAEKDLKRASSKIPFVGGRAKKDSAAGSDGEDDSEALEALEDDEFEALEEDGFEALDDDDFEENAEDDLDFAEEEDFEDADDDDSDD